jgi:hypothetical protein
LVREKEKKMEGGFVNRIAMGNVKSFEYFNNVYIAERERERVKKTEGIGKEKKKKKKIFSSNFLIFY